MLYLIKMTTHILNLHNGPFTAIASGRKTIESRLYDEKRRAIAVGDELIFINRSNPSQTQRVQVTELVLSPSFATLFENKAAASHGDKDVASLLAELDEFYTVDDQARDGVVGIIFTLL